MFPCCCLSSKPKSMSKAESAQQSVDARDTRRGLQRLPDAYSVHSPLDKLSSYNPFASASSSATSSAPFPSPGAASSSSTPPLPPLAQDPIVVGLLSAAVAVSLTLGGIAGYRRYWRRIKNADYITSSMLDGRRWLTGRVTSVGDGDNFRLYHTPGPFYKLIPFRRVPTTSKQLKDQTIHIRIAGVDAPEMAHFGNPAQPHARESLDWLRATITGKTMRCQLLRKDQYQRVVAVPFIKRFLLRDRPLPVLMLQNGMASVYEAGGAEYGPWGLEGLKEYERVARKARKGMWAAKKIELPGEYKKRMKISDGDGPVSSTVSRAKKAASESMWSVLRRMFGRQAKK